MKQSPQIQSRINEIAKELSVGQERAYILGKYGKKWEISRTSIDRLIEKAKPIATGIATRKEQAIEATTLSEVTEAVRNGLKSKIERIMILQNEIDKCINELYGGPEVKNFADIGGSRKNVKDQLTVLEKVKLRQTINQLQSEISKMEGDYTPIKIAQTDTAGNDIIFKLDERFDNH